MKTNGLTGADYYELIIPDLEKIKDTINSVNRYYQKINGREDIPTLKTRINVMVKEMEKLAVFGRSIPLFQYEENDDIEIDKGMEVKINRDNDVLLLELPLLIPKARSNKTNKSYLVSLFHNSFQNHLRNCPKYKEPVVIWFEFQYKERPGKQGYRDHDNIETKIVKDLLVPHIVVDDSPKYCDDFHSSYTGVYDSTFIHVVPRRIFADYYQGRVKNYEKA